MPNISYSSLPVGPGTGANTANTDGTGVGESPSFVATFSGVITTVAKWVAAGGTNTSLRLAIYANNAGVPGARLGPEVVVTTWGNDSWNYFSGFNAPVIAGTTYWVAYLPLGGTHNYSDNAATGGNVKTTAAGQTTLTDPAPAFGTGPFTNIVNVGVMGEGSFIPRRMPLGV